MKKWLMLITCVAWLNLPVQAAEVAGVKLADRITLRSGEVLHLNGAGIRKKFFFKIYVGALYLPGKATAPEQIYTMPGPKRVLMHFIYTRISDKKLVKAWNEGFEDNLGKEQLAYLTPRIEAFNALFPSVKENDEIHLDYYPGIGTEVWLNGHLRGTVPGEDFYTALLKIWLGNEPADSRLKKAMLGK